MDMKGVMKWIHLLIAVVIMISVVILMMESKKQNPSEFQKGVEWTALGASTIMVIMAVAGFMHFGRFGAGSGDSGMEA
jgi:hypothetical protein